MGNISPFTEHGLEILPLIFSVFCELLPFHIQQNNFIKLFGSIRFNPLPFEIISRITIHLSHVPSTNRDLKKMVADREFRSDLYYRLNVFPIHLPPLRERPEDIPLLAKAFTFKIARRLGRNIDSIPAETLRILSNMEWPGNVRELENVIERAVLLTRGNVLQLSLPDIALPEPETPPAATVVAQEGEDEYQLIVRVLKETNGVVAGPKGAAQRLGLKRTTLLSRMKRLGIDKSALI